MTDRSLTNPEKGLIKMFFNQAKRKGNKKEMERLKKMYGMFLDLV
jgi:hypothetical protein